MSSEERQSEDAERVRLPFEPARKTRQKSLKTQSASQAITKNPTEKPKPASSGAVPTVVSNRMIRRVAFFSGLPTAMGMLTFIISYLIVSKEWFNLPNVAVVIISISFFGLGVLGLSYGVLSASWDEDRIGNLLGWNEFTTNLGRMTAAWRSKSAVKTED
ncbi:MAG TPA: PAM68 family protein [Oculatellaceae cyanobacterium]|jgi:VIT1/CCC1 family predicted Fe2+/Mn2+ transporter